MSVRSIYALASAALLLASTAQAATIASWDNTGQLGTQAFTPGTGSPNVTASNMARGATLSPNAAVDSISAIGWDGSDADDYFEFGFSVDPGYQVVLDRLLIGTRSAASGPGTMGVYTSLDAFAAPVVAILQPAGGFVNSSLDLSALGAVTGSFSIRLIEIGDTAANGSGPTSVAGSFRITDYSAPGAVLDTQITGTTSIIPEPGTALLLSAGLAGLSLRRRASA